MDIIRNLHVFILYSQVNPAPVCPSHPPDLKSGQHKHIFIIALLPLPLLTHPQYLPTVPLKPSSCTTPSHKSKEGPVQ